MSPDRAAGASPCPILLINLERSRERLESARSQLAAAGLAAERLPAVDGRAIPADELRRLAPWDRAAFFKPLSPGEVGCYLSHVAAAERIVAENWPVALVLEDDFAIGPGFAADLAAVVALGDALPDMVRLDGSMTGGAQVAALPGGRRLVRHRRPATCTTALLWTRRGAAKFLAAARPLRRPVDVQLKHWWEGDLDILAVAPPPVGLHAIQASTSTIGLRRERSPAESLRQLAYKVGYALRSQLELMRRRGPRVWFRANLG